MLIDVEFDEFSRLFNSGESRNGWKYLANRLFNGSEENVENLYNKRLNIADGTYVIRAVVQIDDSDRIDYGQLFAIKEYIDYLKKQKNPKENKVQSLLDLMNSPEELKIIDKWLLENKFIVKNKKEGPFPYHWEGNKFLENKNRPKKFSKYYQFAIFGYWLCQNNKLNVDFFVGSVIGRAMMAYYTFEKSLTSEKAFTDTLIEQNMDYYLDYYSPLSDYIKANPSR